MTDSSPIFIVGCPRSGTTILAALLNLHTNIAAATETHFFNFISKQRKYKWKEFDENQMKLMLDEARIIDFCKHLEIDPELLIKYFMESFDSAELSEGATQKTEFYKKKVFDVFIRALLEKKKKERFCEKTPQHLYNVEEILKLYPEAKFIHLVRDGRDVVNSLMKMPWRPNGLLNNSRFWKKYIARGLKLSSKIDSSNFLTVKFEDLLQDPETVLRNICEFLDLAYQKSILYKSQTSTESVFTEWESNWKHKSKSDLDPKRIGAWKKELSDQDQALLGWHQYQYLNKLGYELGKLKVNIFDFVRIAQEYLAISFRKVFRVVSHIFN